MSRLRATVNSVPRTTIRTVGVARIATANRLESLLDVDATDVDNNETLVYDSESGKYVVKSIPSIDGGTF